MKETNLDRKRAFWLVTFPALKNQIRNLFETMFHNFYRPQELCLRYALLPKNFNIRIIPFQSNMQRDACCRLHSLRLYF